MEVFLTCNFKQEKSAALFFSIVQRRMLVEIVQAACSFLCVWLFFSFPSAHFGGPAMAAPSSITPDSLLNLYQQVGALHLHPCLSTWAVTLKNLCKMCLVMLTGRIAVKGKRGGAQLLSLCAAPGWACPYCYFWMCQFSIAMVHSIYRIWVATYVRLKSKQVRVCPLMCIYSSLTWAGATYIWKQIQRLW